MVRQLFHTHPVPPSLYSMTVCLQPHNHLFRIRTLIQPFPLLQVPRYLFLFHKWLPVVLTHLGSDSDSDVPTTTAEAADSRRDAHFSPSSSLFTPDVMHSLRRTTVVEPASTFGSSSPAFASPPCPRAGAPCTARTGRHPSGCGCWQERARQVTEAGA